MALGRPSHAKMSTRIVLTNYHMESGQKHLIGLIAEYVMETTQRAECDFVDPGVSATDSPYLGSVMTERDGIVQRMEVSLLLPQSLQEQLFCGIADSA